MKTRALLIATHIFIGDATTENIMPCKNADKAPRGLYSEELTVPEFVELQSRLEETSDASAQPIRGEGVNLWDYLDGVIRRQNGLSGAWVLRHLERKSESPSEAGTYDQINISKPAVPRAQLGAPRQLCPRPSDEYRRTVETTAAGALKEVKRKAAKRKAPAETALPACDAKRQRGEQCVHEGCEFSAKKKSNLKDHIAWKHGGERLHKCMHEGCEFVTKTKRGLKNHMARKFLHVAAPCALQAGLV